MPFALPEYDAAFARFMGEAMHELAAARDPLLSQIDVEEGPGAIGSVIQDQEGRDVEIEPASLEADLTMVVPAVRDGDIDALVIQLDSAAEQLREGMARTLFGALNVITNATGNVLEAKGPPTFESIYEGLEKMEWSLTDDDDLSMPTIVLSPEAMAALPPETDEQRALMEQLRQRKLRELLARRRRRRLS